LNNIISAGKYTILNEKGNVVFELSEDGTTQIISNNQWINSKGVVADTIQGEIIVSDSDEFVMKLVGLFNRVKFLEEKVEKLESNKQDSKQFFDALSENLRKMGKW